MNISYNNKDAEIKATILDDGTLVINMPTDITRIRRVFVEEKDSQYGSMFYPDIGDEPARCKAEKERNGEDKD